MNPTPIFTEKQRFPAIWLALFAIAINSVFFYGIYVQIICGHPFGSKPMPDNLLLISASLVFLLTILFVSFKLETEIREDGIYYRFFPIQLKMKKTGWEEMSKCFVRQYRPIAEYGGWGLRMGIFGAGRAVNISGNKGIQIVKKDNKRLLIGTKKQEEVEKILKQLGKWSAE